MHDVVPTSAQRPSQPQTGARLGEDTRRSAGAPGPEHRRGPWQPVGAVGAVEQEGVHLHALLLEAGEQQARLRLRPALTVAAQHEGHSHPVS